MHGHTNIKKYVYWIVPLELVFLEVHSETSWTCIQEDSSSKLERHPEYPEFCMSVSPSRHMLGKTFLDHNPFPSSSSLCQLPSHRHCIMCDTNSVIKLYAEVKWKHQLDATLCRFYFFRVTLHVSGASAHNQEYSPPDDGRLGPKHVEWPCRNKTCTVLHQVGVFIWLILWCTEAQN